MIKTKIGLLVAGHLVAGISAAVFCHETLPHPLTVVSLALILGDAGLLGIWLALGGGRWWKRGGVILAATIYVGWLGWISIFGVSLVLFFDPPIALVAIGLAIFRRKGLRIDLVSSTAAEGLQFSIRHLFVCTTIVAVLLAAGRGIRAITAGASTMFLLLLTAIICISAIVPALTGLWASLGTGRPSQRLLVVLVVAALLGMLPPYYLANVHPASGMFIAWTALSVMIAVVINGSLLIVRSCGYRLVRSTTEVAGSAGGV